MPGGFGAGIIVFLIKDKSGNMNDTNNYRPITLTPVISKVFFENVILSLCQQCFMTDELQFGLKQNMSCSDAVFAVRSAVSYFIERDSCVYAATLDFKKAFNIVNPGFYPDALCLGNSKCWGWDSVGCACSGVQG